MAVLSARSVRGAMVLTCALGVMGCPANPPRNPAFDASSQGDVVDAQDGRDDAVGDDVVGDVVVDAGVAADAPWTLRGEFVSAAVQGSGAGYTLQGVMHWTAAVEGTGGGYTLRGTLW